MINPEFQKNKNFFAPPFQKEESRKIIHVDMDAFFASVEIHDNPSLKNLPVIVGGNPESRGVVAASNYIAREFGIHSAMPSFKAKQLCPQAVFLYPRFERYQEVSRQIREVFEKFTDKVQMVSLDEAWLDVTQNKINESSAIRVGKEVQRKILQKTDLTCSVGVSFNKVLAKLCSEEKKPAGFFCIPPEKSNAYLMQILIHRVPGVGKVTWQKMESLGIRIGSDLHRFSLEELKKLFGKTGQYYYDVIRGIHYSPVCEDREEKSVSVETTFSKNLLWGDSMQQEIVSLTEKFWVRLRRKNVYGKTLNVKIKFSDFRQITRSLSLPFHCTDFSVFRYAASKKLRETLTQEYPEKPVRLIGIGISNLISAELLKEKGRQLTLFKDFAE